MFLDSCSHKICSASSFVDAGEKLSLLVAVVPLHTIVPGNAVVYEVRLVCRRQARGLLIDAVESPYKRVVANSHFRRFDGERVRL